MQYKKTEVRDRILDSARKEFIKYGKERSSIRRIASRADMAIGNIYNYFKNKEDIFDCLIADTQIEVDNFFKDIMMGKLDEDFIGSKFISAIPYIVNHKHEIMMIMNIKDKHEIKNRDRYFKVITEKIKEEGDAYAKRHNKEPFPLAYARALAKSFIYGTFEVLLFSRDEQTAKYALDKFLNFFFSDFKNRL